MVDRILAISGKPGLYKLVARGNNMLIVESLIDGRRGPAHQRDRVLSLGDISMYTVDGEVPLNIVFAKAKELTGGTKSPVGINDPAVEQRAWFAKVMPEYDEDRVRAGDIKKFIQWYNILVETGNDDFSEPEEEAAEEATEA